MLSEGKVATPAIAANVRVPPKVPPAGFVPIATVTLPTNPVAVFPSASRAVTRTAGLIVAPAVAVGGCSVDGSRVADAGGIVNAAHGAPDVQAIVAWRE